jgi:hypothetical protein
VPPASSTRTHADTRKVLARAGVPSDRVEAALAELPDPFDVEREEPILARHGITIGLLMEAFGGSP